MGPTIFFVSISLQIATNGEIYKHLGILILILTPLSYEERHLSYEEIIKNTLFNI